MNALKNVRMSESARTQTNIFTAERMWALGQFQYHDIKSLAHCIGKTVAQNKIAIIEWMKNTTQQSDIPSAKEVKADGIFMRIPSLPILSTIWTVWCVLKMILMLDGIANVQATYFRFQSIGIVNGTHIKKAHPKNFQSNFLGKDIWAVYFSFELCVISLSRGFSRLLFVIIFARQMNFCYNNSVRMKPKIRFRVTSMFWIQFVVPHLSNCSWILFIETSSNDKYNNV